MEQNWQQWHGEIKFIQAPTVEQLGLQGQFLKIGQELRVLMMATNWWLCVVESTVFISAVTEA